jgi:hypothetical protein
MTMRPASAEAIRRYYTLQAAAQKVAMRRLIPVPDEGDSRRLTDASRFCWGGRPSGILCQC